MTCQCNNGLGDFNIDWGGLATNVVKAYATVQQTRSALVIQRAQQEAALRAQAAEIQAMQRRQAAMIAQPVESGVRAPVKQPSMVDGLPPWVLPVGAGLLLLLVVRR